MNTWAEAARRVRILREPPGAGISERLDLDADDAVAVAADAAEAVDETDLVALGCEQALVDQVERAARLGDGVVGHDHLEHVVATAVVPTLDREVPGIRVLADEVARPPQHGEQALGAPTAAVGLALDRLDHGLVAGTDRWHERLRHRSFDGIVVDGAEIGCRHGQASPSISDSPLESGKLTIRRQFNAVNWKI